MSGPLRARLALPVLLLAVACESDPFVYELNGPQADDEAGEAAAGAEEGEEPGAGGAATSGAPAGADSPPDAGSDAPDPGPAATGLYALQAERLDGTPTPLDAWAGKVTLVVNTASRCGLTPQYDQLQTLHERYGADGRFAVLGFPCNQFGGQEPGTADEIAAFCETNYGVTFPLFAKVRVKGDGQSEVFAFLTERFPEPEWNFRKYLVGPDGRVLASFEPRTPPDAPAVVAAIEAALAG